APIAADEARVSMVRMAQTVKRMRSKRPRTRSRAEAAGGAGTAAECPSVMLAAQSYPRKALRHNDFRTGSRSARRVGLAARVIGCPRLRQPARELRMSASIRLKTAIPGPLSRALAARREAAVPKGIGHSTPVYAASARGALLTDVDGNVFLD